MPSQLLGGKKNLDLGLVFEGFLSFDAIFTPHPAMDKHNSIISSQKRRDACPQVIQRIPVLGENDKFLPG